MATTVLTASLTRFYEIPEHADVLESIANGKSPVSLRLVEWFVNSDREVHQDYIAHLRAYTRRLFDPFRRSNRLVLYYCDRSFESTLGQMNFFKWLIEEGHWDRLVTGKEELTESMMSEGKARAKGSAALRAKPAKQVQEDYEPVQSWRPQTLLFE